MGIVDLIKTSNNGKCGSIRSVERIATISDIGNGSRYWNRLPMHPHQATLYFQAP